MTAVQRHSRLHGAPVRFLLAGLLNTVATTALYVALLQVLAYPLAYSVAFVAGVALAYVLNRLFVFRAERGLVSVVALPLIYLLQYAIGLVVVFAWVDVLGGPEALASLVAVAVTIPITYLLSRRAFVGRGDA